MDIVQPGKFVCFKVIIGSRRTLHIESFPRLVLTAWELDVSAFTPLLFALLAIHLAGQFSIIS